MLSIISLDVRTLAFVATLIAIVMAGAMTLLWQTNRDEKSTRHWAAAANLVAFGFLLIGLRGYLPALLSVLLADILLVAGSGLMLTGIAVFNGRRLSPWVVPLAVVATLVLIAWFTYGIPSVNNRIAVISLIVGILSLWAAGLLIVGSTPGMAFSQNLTAAVFAGHGVFLLGRAVAALWSQRIHDLMGPSSLQVLSFLEVTIALACVGIGFLSMTNRRLHLRLDIQARRDPLTGVSNRRALEAVAEQTLALRERHLFPLSVLLMDIDRFKEINDRHGHAAGDAVLRAFAEAASGALRHGDAFGRFGGEEFCAILPYAEAKSARQVAERVCEAIRGMTVRHGESALSVTVSIGVATADVPCRGWATLIREADANLYIAKQGGRNRVAA